METRESLLKLTNPQLLDLLRARKIGGYSGKKKDELISMILTPPPAGSVRSPGRPPGTGTKMTTPPKTKPKKEGRPKGSVTKDLSIEYTKAGLEGVNATVLKKLSEFQQVGPVSGKNKEQIISQLLTKPLTTVIFISVTTKSGNVSNVKVYPAGVHVGVQQGSVQPQVNLTAVKTASPSASSVAAPVTVPSIAGTFPSDLFNRSPSKANYIPAIAFRQ